MIAEMECPPTVLRRPKSLCQAEPGALSAAFTCEIPQAGRQDTKEGRKEASVGQWREGGRELAEDTLAFLDPSNLPSPSRPKL